MKNQVMQVNRIGWIRVQLARRASAELTALSGKREIQTTAAAQLIQIKTPTKVCSEAARSVYRQFTFAHVANDKKHRQRLKEATWK